MRKVRIRPQIQGGYVIESNPYGTELKRIRKAAGKSQTDVGKLAGCSAQHVCKIEKGEKAPFSRLLTDRIIDGLGVPSSLMEHRCLYRGFAKVDLRRDKDGPADAVKAVMVEFDKGMSESLARRILNIVEESRNESDSSGDS